MNCGCEFHLVIFLLFIYFYFVYMCVFTCVWYCYCIFLFLCVFICIYHMSHGPHSPRQTQEQDSQPTSYWVFHSGNSLKLSERCVGYFIFHSQQNPAAACPHKIHYTFHLHKTTSVCSPERYIKRGRPFALPSTLLPSPCTFPLSPSSSPLILHAFIFYIFFASLHLASFPFLAFSLPPHYAPPPLRPNLSWPQDLHTPNINHLWCIAADVAFAILFLSRVTTLAVF